MNEETVLVHLKETTWLVIGRVFFLLVEN